MKNKAEILKAIKKEAEYLEIPETLSPECMQKKIKQQEAQNAAKKKKEKNTFYQFALAVVACACLIVGMAKFTELLDKEQSENPQQAEHMEQDMIFEEITTVGMAYPKIIYEDIYASMELTWEEENQWRTSMEMPEAAVEESVVDGGATGTYDTAMKMNAAADLSDDVGTTNVQTVGVDEGDIVKNDGRYLYQKIWKEIDHTNHPVIQIVDTKDGLSEVSRIDGFDDIVEFYVWNDVLVVIENKYMDYAESSRAIKMHHDVAYFGNYYHEITFFNLTDRSNPEKIKTFTLQGSYASSRIANGYFYGFSKYYANKGENEKDYAAYIPLLDGEYLAADRIYLPEENKSTTYLVLVAIDLENPTQFTDTTGIVAGGDLYYVSPKNIYVADCKNIGVSNGWSSNTTSLLRFSYEDGKFALLAKGDVKGRLDSSFSMDEYNGYLRLVSTVNEYELVEIVDDRTGEVIGSEIQNERQTNALYVLDETLNVIGSVENLAENEQIYSARFMGNTAYFVTFRQTDPLFAVDLTDIENPTVLSELKVSGFSEYLHGYGDGLLFGLGMEADEETGRQEGMKLSMFDISDNTNVQEITRLPLDKYNYSEALYNHHALMIQPNKNIIGFEAEGSDRGGYWKDYLIFTYENDVFVQKLKIDTKNENGHYYFSRGTYIGDVFYLLCGDGSITSYDLNSGEKLESLGP